MEKGNRKHNQQKSNKHQKPQSSKKRTATVLIFPDSETKADIQTGNVSDLEMYYHLQHLAKAFAEKLCSDAKEVVGDDPKKQMEYLDWRIEQSGINQ